MSSNNKTKRNPLGRGLEALLHDAGDLIGGPQSASLNPQAKPSAAAVSEILLNEIEPNPYQPRVTFDQEALEELAESIRVLGIIQPLTLRRLSDHRYQIISGERRFRAAKLAGLTKVPAYIRDTDDAGMLEMAIVENVQRENLDPIETALSYQRLIDECNLTQEAMADRVGKKRATVTNFLRLLKLPVEVQKAVKLGGITMGHAKALLSVEDGGKQIDLCDRCISGGWSVRQLEDAVKRIGKPRAIPLNEEEEEKHLPDDYYRMLEAMGRYFGNNISLKRNSKGDGTMTIKFKNDAEIARFLKALESID